MGDELVKESLRTLITANHILHHHKLVDAYGHISIRHPLKPNVYVMSQKMAPGIVESPDDLIEYKIVDNLPVDPQAKPGHIERFIHGHIFKRFPQVNCVVHSHSEDVLPFVVSDIPLRAPCHMAGFLGDHVPVFDIATLYEDADRRTLLVENDRFGASLASTFSKDPKSPITVDASLDYDLVLMRRHGFTVVGESIPSAVFRAYYACYGARILSSAINLRVAVDSSDQAHAASGITYLSPAMQRDTKFACDSTLSKPWDLWVREVESSPLYRNKA